MLYQLQNLNTTHIRAEFTSNSITIYILTNGIMIRWLSDFSPWIFIFWLIFFCFRCVLSVFLSVIVSLHCSALAERWVPFKVHIIQMLILGGGSIQGTTLSHWPSSKAIYCHFSLKILGTILDQWPLPWLTSTSNIAKLMNALSPVVGFLLLSGYLGWLVTRSMISSQYF